MKVRVRICLKRAKGNEKTQESLLLLNSKVILISGGTGSFGQSAVRYLLKHNISKVIVLSRDEKKQWDMAKEIQDNRVRYFIGSIRDKERLERAFQDVDYIIHAAALKQVPALEYNPIEAIQTNILGTQNVINAAIDQGVSKVIMLSSDKACNPINLYGATKLCAEKLMIASNAYSRKKPMLSVVRYGNVTGSRGSVVELFEKQKETGTLTITDDRMTRFWISIDNAVKFVFECLNRMQGGEIFIPKLPSRKIIDVAKEIAPTASYKMIGVRPGEKLHEVLISKDESQYAEEKEDCFIIRQGEPINDKQFQYSSS